MMNSLIIQLIGVIAYIILEFSYFKKNKKDILFIQIFSTIAFAIHYYLLGGMTATVCNLISLLIIIIIYFFEKHDGKNKKVLILSTIPLLILISLFTYENIFSIFPIIASTIVLISFIISNENTIRISGIISALCWMVYAIIYKSYAGIFFEAFSAVSTFIAFLRNFNIKNKNILENKKVIIFDLDGTLIDSVNMFNEIYSFLIKNTTGKKILADQIQDDWDEFAHQSIPGDLFDNFLLYLDKKYSSEVHDIEFLRKMYENIEYKYLSEEIEYKKYAKDVILKLKEKGYILVLATLSPKSRIDIYNNINKKLINEFKMNDVFDLILTSEDVKNKKPNPEVYLKVLEKLNVSNEKCLIIEDSLEGVKAANNAEIEVLNIVDKNMYKTQSTIDKLSTYKMNNLKELLKLI